MKGFPGGLFIGDYMGLAATEDDVFLVWPDTRLGEYGGYCQQIGFARKTAIEAPSLFLSPPSGSAGRIVDIQGFSFQPDAAIQLYVSGVITSTLRTDLKGQFQTSIYMPLTGEGPTEIRAYDETGNVATASFYTEFGFDSLQDQLGAIEAALGLTPAAQATPQPAGTPVAVGVPDRAGRPSISRNRTRSERRRAERASGWRQARDRLRIDGSPRIGRPSDACGNR